MMPSWIKSSKRGEGWNKNAMVYIFYKKILGGVYSGLESIIYEFLMSENT